jgi:hypothetical protein
MAGSKNEFFEPFYYNHIASLTGRDIFLTLFAANVLSLYVRANFKPAPNSSLAVFLFW